MLRQAAAMHYTAQEEMRLAESVIAGLPRGVVIPPGLDDVYFEEPASPNRQSPYVLSLSRLDPKKGIDTLIDAFHTVASDRELQPWRLVIAGDGEQAFVQVLRERAARGAAGPRIEFAGWVSGARKRELVRGASLFALASRQENFGIALAEAMAAGVPVVTSPDVNLAPEITAASAGWIATDTMLPSILLGAMRDEHGRAERGARGRTLAESFRWSRVATELTALYESLQPARLDAPRFATTTT